MYVLTKEGAGISFFLGGGGGGGGGLIFFLGAGLLKQ